MDVVLNGKSTSLKSAGSVADLLRTLGYDAVHVAVALNRTCVRRADFQTTLVNDGDEIEVLAPMAGG